MREHDHFFSQLPESDFLPQEWELREKLLSILKRACRPRAGHSRGSHALLHIESLPHISEIVGSLLPHGVSLLEWVQRRVNDDIEALQDDTQEGLGVIVLKRRTKDPNVHLQEVEGFLAGLPEDSFTDDEDALRRALASFVESWQGQGPPRLTDAATDPDVSAAKKQLLPEGVGLSAWITGRIGGEIDLIKDATGQYAIGFVGQLDPLQVRKGTKRSHANAPWTSRKR